MKKRISNLEETTKGFIRYKKPLRIKTFEIVGYYPYETARVRGLKVPREVFATIQDELFINNYPVDNKIVLICKDIINFGTHSFALFLHDGGGIIGAIDAIEKY